MTRTSFLRLSGAILVTGGLVGAGVPVLHPVHGPAYYADPMTATSHLVLLAAVALVSLGLPGLVAAQGGRVRTLAGLGVALVFVAEWLLDGVHSVVDGVVLPALAQDPTVRAMLAQGSAGGARAAGDAAAHGSAHAPALGVLLDAGPLGTLAGLGVPVMILGCLVLGAAVWRGGALPRWTGALVALSWALFPLSFVAPQLQGWDVSLPYVAFTALGGAMLARAGRLAGHGAVADGVPRAAAVPARGAHPAHAA
jgi:hypothetical protein